MVIAWIRNILVNEEDAGKSDYMKIIYRKILRISPGPTLVQKAFFAGLIFGGNYFWKALLLEGILRFKMGWT